MSIDASSLPAGIILDGGGSSRVMEIGTGSVVTLTALSIRGGKAPEGETGATGGSGFGLGDPGEPGGPGQSGGGILNHGALPLTGVTLSGNAAGNGGAGGAGGPGIFQGDGGNGGAGGSGGALHNSRRGVSPLNAGAGYRLAGGGLTEVQVP